MKRGKRLSKKTVIIAVIIVLVVLGVVYFIFRSTIETGVKFAPPEQGCFILANGDPNLIIPNSELDAYCIEHPGKVAVVIVTENEGVNGLCVAIVCPDIMPTFSLHEFRPFDSRSLGRIQQSYGDPALGR